jgi:predicted nucleic acid-binding protein
VTALIDTNILVYAAGIRADTARQRHAIAVLSRWHQDGCLALQVLAEFSAVALRHGMPLEQCQYLVTQYRRAWRILVPSVATLDLALQGVAQYHLHFWDAMLWALAREHGLREIVTEDGPTGQSVGGVTFRNPFLEP